MPTSITVVATSTWTSPAAEPPHDLVALLGLEPAVHQAHRELGPPRRQRLRPSWSRRADRPAPTPRSPAARRTPGAPARTPGARTRAPSPAGSPVADGGAHRAPARRPLPQGGDVEIAVERERERARNRRGREQQDVGRRALADQRGPLLDAEAVLLVDHHQARAGGTRRSPASARGCRPRAAPARRRAAPRTAVFSAAVWRPSSSSGRMPSGASSRAERGGVLLGQQLGGRHERRLEVVLHREQHGEERDDGLAGARRRPSAGGACAPARSCRR